MTKPFCPYCAKHFDDVDAHIRKDHVAPPLPITAPVTGLAMAIARDDTLAERMTCDDIERCLSTVDRLRTLTREKQELLDRLYRWFQAARERKLQR